MVLSHRIFITRDNSTGFTIQWGVCGGDTTANWPRRFASVLSFSACEKTGAWLVSTVSAVTNTNFYLHGRAQAYFMAFGFTQSRDNSTGFTIQWGKNEISGYGYTTINFPRSFNVIYAMARSDYRASKGEGTSGSRDVAWFNTSQARIGYEGGYSFVAVGFS